MAAEPRVPRKPKLRSSCDACGAAKLKCNRGQPECERCISLGIPCVYGVSRKMGKPPRYKPKVASTPPDQSAAPGSSMPTDRGLPEDPGRFGAGSLSPRSRSISNFDNLSLAWNPVADAHPHQATFDAFAADETDLKDLYGDAFPQILPSPPKELGDTLPMLGSQDFDSIAASIEMGDTRSTSVDEMMFMDNASLSPESNSDHNCLREAHCILARLSLTDVNSTTSMSPPAFSSPGRHDSVSSMSSATPDLPLDQILHLTREAGQRLSRLLTCQCSHNPHLAFLCATIISRILLWYQQAAMCVRSGSLCTDLAALTNTQFDNLLRSGSTTTGSSGWVNGTTTGGSPSTSSGSTAGLPTPMKISLGTFSIEDGRMEAALTAQLLLSELRRTGGVIDMLNMQKSGGSPGGYGLGSGVEDLHKSLNAPLAQMHTRIVEDVRSLSREMIY